MIHLKFREFLLGKKDFILSHTEYKRAILVGQLCLLTVALCTAYLILDISNQVYHGLIFQIGCACLALVALLFNRARFYTTAKLILAFSINLTVFGFAQVEPKEVGLYMFYIPTSLGALAAFGYEERRKSILLILLPISFFALSQLTDISFIQKTSHRADLDQLNFIINFGGSLLASVFIIYFLIRVNYSSEANLVANEKQLIEKNNELSKLNTELDRFVYSTSHDLMAPLSSVKGLIYLTRMSEDKNETSSLLSMMEERVESLQKFIRDISDYSRNSRIEVTNENFSIHKLVKSILENLRFYPNIKKINIELNIPANLHIISDPNRIQIVLSNLITNSIKYSDISKENCFVKISTSIHETEVQFRIEDNGIGIKEDHLNSVFEMFYKASENSEGSGLGLYIVKQTIEKLNGTISVSSKYRMGTSFLVSIPLKEKGQLTNPLLALDDQPT